MATRRGLRAGRLAQEIQREVSELIRLELKDPRVHTLITITEVEVTNDLRHATIYFTVMDGEAGAGMVLAALERATGFIRGQLADRLRLRVVPELHWAYDASVARGARLSSLIDAAVRGGKTPSGSA